MPLFEAYDKSLDSDYADMNNISSLSEAGSITAALFLRRFVPKDSKWLHVDMAGPMEKAVLQAIMPNRQQVMVHVC